MLNTQLALQVISELLSLGVEEFCVCPGARNAPLISILSANSERWKSYYFFEERSAAFFALGRIRNTGKPVAVVTTSGTAAGELLPAAMEGQYSGLPLVLVTADRPRHYRGSGAPQTAEQVGLFGTTVSRCLDVEGSEKLSLEGVNLSRPLHINVCFDEPLLEKSELGNRPYLMERRETSSLPELGPSSGPSLGPSEQSLANVRAFFKKAQCPIVVVGLLHPSERKAIVDLLLNWNLPVYFEALSGLREDPRLDSLRLQLSDGVLERANRADFKIDSVIRIGGVPTLRLWRDLEQKCLSFEVLSLSSLPFSGLGRASFFVHEDLNRLCPWIMNDAECRPSAARPLAEALFQLDREVTQRLENLLMAEPTSEPGMIAALSQRMPSGAGMYLGNSMPIREWDLAAARKDQKLDVWGSRGLNGIDGQVSTFLGFAQKDRENWAVIGDLTALYDLPGPWILSQMPEARVNLVVMNNEGGKIFSRIFAPLEFQNRHQLRFGAWAELWGLNYESWTEVPETTSGAAVHRLIEMLPNEEATQRFWKEYETLLCTADSSPRSTR